MQGAIQNDFVLTSKIGSGNFSTVYLAKHIQTQQIVAIKTMKNHIPIAVKQAQILKKINHPNVIKLFKFQKPKNKQQAQMVLEYLPQNILQLYEAQQYGLKEEQVKCILFQSCLGLFHIHKKGIIHRDIKPENIMINRNKAEVKLIDFGLAIQQGHCITDYVATRWYRAPQNLLSTKQYTVSIDIFSLGCVIVQLYTGNPLFPGSNNVDQICKILTMMGEPTIHSWRKGYQMFMKLGLNFHLKSDKKKSLKNLMTSCSQGLIKIIQRMLVLNPFKRITAQEILKDSYFNDIQKIIPPHVFQRYLTDIKQIRTSFFRQDSKKQVRNEVKERVRFLSEEKGFGAFSSFKSGLTSNKLQNLMISKNKSKQKHFTATNQIKRRSEIERQNPNLQSFYLTSSIKQNRQLSTNKSQQKFMVQSSHSKSFLNGEASTSVKNSIEDYQKNLLKLSTSLQNMKNLNSFQNHQMQTKMDQKTISKQNSKSSEMLSFRGFNQPKQRNQPLKQSTSFLPKKDDSQKHFPIKSKKIMEYLQKFQNLPIKKQQVNKMHDKKQISSFVHESLNAYPNTTKKPSFMSFDSQKKQFFGKHLSQIKPNQDNRLSEAGTYQQRRGNDSFYKTKQVFSSGVLQSYKNDYKPIIRRNETNNQKIDRLRNQNYQNRGINSPSIERSYQTTLTKSIESPMNKINPILKVKFNQPGQQAQFLKNDNQNPQTNFVSLNRSSQFNAQKSFIHSPNRMSHKHYNNFSQDFTSFQETLNNQTKLSNGQSMNLSSSRPIENKMKMIAVRQSIPSEAIQNWHSKQKPIKLSFQNSDQSNFFKTPLKSEFVFKKNTNIIKNIEAEKMGSINSFSSLHSPRKQRQIFQSPSKYNHNQSHTLNGQNRFLNQSVSKFKYFKSIHHPQVSSFKSPERYSLNNPQPQVRRQLTNNFVQFQNKNFSSIDPYHSFLGNSKYLHNHTQSFHPTQSFQSTQQQKKMTHKHSQTALSQLRQSITGLTKTQNQGTFLSERSDKYANKNININLNLNIFEQKSHRKK